MAIISIVTFLTIIFVIAAIVIFILVYRFHYTKQVNRALETGIPEKTLSPSVTLLGFVIGLILLTNIYMVGFIITQDSTISDINNQVNTLEYNLDKLNTELLEAIDESNSIARNANIYIKTFNDDTITYTLDFRLTEVEKNSTITIQVRDRDNVITSYPVTEDNYMYSTDITLPHTSQYRIYLNIDTPTKIVNEQLLIFSPNEFLIDRFLGMANKEIDFEDDLIYIDFMNEYETFSSSDKLQVSSMKLYVYDTDSGEEYNINVNDFENGNSPMKQEAITSLVQLPVSFKKDARLTIYLTIIDNAGLQYTFNLTGDYYPDLEERANR